MNVENEELPMYIVQNAELLQAEALGVVTEGWGDRSTDSMWVDQEWWMADRGEPESDNDEAEETSSDDTDLDSDTQGVTCLNISCLYCHAQCSGGQMKYCKRHHNVCNSYKG